MNFQGVGNETCMLTPTWEHSPLPGSHASRARRQHFYLTVAKTRLSAHPNLSFPPPSFLSIALTLSDMKVTEFKPKTDIPNLEGKTIFITGGISTPTVI
jgi:hypothetical protein